MTKVNPLIAILVCIAAIAVGAYFVWQEIDSQQTAVSCSSIQPTPVIVAFGDSLVAGYGAESQQGFVGPLSQKVGVNIIDEGESGDTTAQALTRLPNVLAQHPTIVIVLLGGNDALQKIPQSTTQSNLSQILSTLQQNHIKIVLIGVLGGFPVDPYASMFQSLAKEYNAVYVPNILSGLIGNNKYMYDEVHPNAAGYDIAANKIYTALETACGDLKTS